MNSAFVFIKPHANTELVQQLVKETFEAQGIKILTEGTLTGPEIDAGMLIDQHYYAIASKATLLKPDQLPVPADKFEEQFKLPWSEALSKGLVYNALGACEYLGVDANGLDELWGQCKKANKLIKFGGGFYCGLIDNVPGKEPIYTFNAFFMSMRSKFVAADVSIHYYVVEWDQAALSWKDFRGQVLGPTDPSEAPADSLRGQVLARWEALGLKSVPNTGDNGVHASASPFEALAERMNWLKVAIEEDPFGRRLLSAGITAETIREWSVDPQVGGRSLFDSLEDTDSDECLIRCVFKVSIKNSAFVFIKPHANTELVQQLVKETFEAKGIKILTEGTLTGPEIDAGMLIDQHYYAIASKATLLKPDQLPVPADKFEEQFKLPWSEALSKGLVYNALGACEYLGVDANGLDELWGQCKKANKLIKFGGGFYCGLIDNVPGKEPIYTFNAFFMSMRSKFVAADVSIHYYVVEWDQAALSWKDFRGQVLGPTDPSEAPADSLRGQVLARWEALGLKSVPNTGDNGVHASASPFEALAERMNWLKVAIEEDPFGRRLLSAGITAETIREWSVDPQVGGRGLFDTFEDLDSSDCVLKAKELV